MVLDVQLNIRAISVLASGLEKPAVLERFAQLVQEVAGRAVLLPVRQQRSSAVVLVPGAAIDQLADDGLHAQMRGEK